MRWAFPVCIAVLLVLVTGCLGLGEPEVEEVEIVVRENVEGVVDNTTVVKTGEGWGKESGGNVSDECVRELKQLVLRNKVEVGVECPETEAESGMDEIRSELWLGREEAENRTDELVERAENLTEELKQAKERNQTDRVTRIKGNLDEVNQTISELTQVTDCNHPLIYREYVVNFTYTNSTKVTVRSSMEPANPRRTCTEEDYSWRIESVEGGNVTDEGKIVASSDRVTHLVERLR